jgi:signal transduction histidine kinase
VKELWQRFWSWLFWTADGEDRPQRVFVTRALVGLIPTMAALAISNIVLTLMGSHSWQQQRYLLAWDLLTLAGLLASFYLNRQGKWQVTSHLLFVFFLMNTAAVNRVSNTFFAIAMVSIAAAFVYGLPWGGAFVLLVIVLDILVQPSFSVWRVIMYLCTAGTFHLFGLDFRHHYAALRFSRDTIRQLYHRLANAQEAERERLARELHDDVIQRLVDVGYQVDLQNVAPEKAARIDEAIQSVELCLRKVIQNLYPLELDGALATAIRYLPTGEVQLTVNTGDTNEAGADLPTDLKLTAYRVIQEAVANAVKHANASQITIDLSVDDSCLNIQVSDDGRGFDVSAARSDKHYGLRIIRERLEAVGAELHIVSSETGTRLSTAIPFSNYEDNTNRTSRRS